MDDLFIQEEVIVKTEPLNTSCSSGFEGEQFDDKFGLDVPNNEDLMVYLKYLDKKDDKSFIKKENFETSEPANFFEPDHHFMDPDIMIAHYEEVQAMECASGMNSEDQIMGELLLLTKDTKPKKPARKRKPSTKHDDTSHSFSPSPIKQPPSKSIAKYSNANTFKKCISFECSLCMFITSNESDLKQHMLEHIGGPDTDTFIEESHNGEAYSCIFCLFTSVSSEVFKDHIKFKHSGPRHRHSFESKEIKAMESEDEEDELGTSDPKANDKHKCKQCKYQTSSKEEMNKHMVKFHAEKLLACSQCSFVTFYRSTLKRHEWRHTGAKLRSCEHCSFTTDELETFHSHLKTHNEPKPYGCDECSFKGKTTESLRQHKRNHNGDMPFKCSFCPYKAAKKSRIIRHERIHTGERPFACPHCAFKCNQGSTLKIHIRRHTGEKPYRCLLCSFRTVSRCSLNAHMRKHSANAGGEYVCDVCDQIYNNPTALSKHKKSHTEPESGSLKPVKNRRRKFDDVNNDKTKVKRNKRDNSAAAAAAAVTPTKNTRKASSKSTPTKTSPSQMMLSPLPVARSYQCSICNFQCNKFMELSDHMTSHKKKGNGDPDSSSSSAKKYRCTICNLDFTRKRAMKSHLKQKHEGKNEKEVTIKIGSYTISVADE